MRVPISTVLVVVLGLVVLLGYFLPVEPLASVRKILLEWSLILLAFAVLAGIFNMFSVHWRKLLAGEHGRIYSLTFLLALALTLGVASWFGPTHAYSLWIFNNIQVPIETSLFAILLVVLVFAAFRLLSHRLNLLSVIFVITTVVILLTSGPLFGLQVPGFSELREWIARVPAAAGARGILLGVSLGIIATGLRVLIGADRPYEG